MPLGPGTRIGSYEIVAPIGAGGMGEVYRARDTKLNRDVAIKVLPELFTGDPERLARFHREAQVLAALNHPNIAHVYGVEDLPPKGGSHTSMGSGSHTSIGRGSHTSMGSGVALVMELVEGEDLAQMIARGPLPLDEALPMARQIAEALEAAHAQGIVHRDLKPANILVSPEGAVKVLDFGLAKIIDTLQSGPASELANSPTITSPFAMSRLGVILGTAAYMAPEQAKGKAVDKRADIWAFGCVLFEMLTARRAFPGDDVTDTLAAIVRGEPDWTALPAGTPAPVVRLLRRCLEKDPRERLPDIGVARLELKDALLPENAAAHRASVSHSTPRWIPWAIAGVAVLVAAGALVAALRRSPVPDTRVFKTMIMPPAPLTGAPALRMAISPDGRQLAFVAADEAGRTVLWVRPLDTGTAQPLAGTVDAAAPFWSPDSRSIGFLAEGKLKRIDAAGGRVQTLCSTPLTPPATWNRDDVIVFTGPGNTLMRIAATGGLPVPVFDSARDTSQLVQISPFFLPDGEHFLYTGGATAASRTGVGIYLGSLSARSSTKLLDAASNAAYADGYLLYLRDTTLVAHQFDEATLRLRGDPTPISEDIIANPLTGTGAFTVSGTGLLLYQAGGTPGLRLAWYDRSGKPLGTIAGVGDYRDVQLSPDERTVSFTKTQDGSLDVWLYDLARGVSRRFTFGGGSAAVWTHDGKRLLYTARRGGQAQIIEKEAAGGGRERIVVQDSATINPMAISPDDTLLLYATLSGIVSGTLHAVRLQSNPAALPVSLPSNGSQVPAELSPNGRWLAYVSNESGSRQLYVTSFPDGVGKWQISTDTAETPRWRADGRELYYSSQQSKIVAVSVDGSGAQFDVGPAHELFSARVPAPNIGTHATFAVTHDGQRFLVNTYGDSATVTPITVLVNWTATLR